MMSDYSAADVRELEDRIKANHDRYSKDMIQKEMEIHRMKQAEAERIQAAKPPDHSREIASLNKMVEAAMNDAEEMESYRCGAWYDATTIHEQMLWPDTKPPSGWPKKWYDFGDYVRMAYGLTPSGTKLLVEPSSGKPAPLLVEPAPAPTFLDALIDKALKGR
jgi:hypothetical protein